MSRASPFGAILSHCQPTVMVIASGMDGVVQVSTTSCPRRSSFPPTTVQVQTRPSVSVTLRWLAIWCPEGVNTCPVLLQQPVFRRLETRERLSHTIGHCALVRGKRAYYTF